MKQNCTLINGEYKKVILFLVSKKYSVYRSAYVFYLLNPRSYYKYVFLYFATQL